MTIIEIHPKNQRASDSDSAEQSAGEPAVFKIERRSTRLRQDYINLVREHFDGDLPPLPPDRARDAIDRLIDDELTKLLADKTLAEWLGMPGRDDAWVALVLALVRQQLRSSRAWPGCPMNSIVRTIADTPVLTRTDAFQLADPNRRSADR